MSNLLYLHSFPWDRYVKAKRSMKGLRPKPISPMGLGLPVLEAWAPRFKKARAGKWLELLAAGEGTFVLEPERLEELSMVLAAVAALESPKLAGPPRDHEEFEDAFEEELLEPLTKAAAAKAGLFGQWA